MSRYIQIEEISGKLLLLPALIRQQEQRSAEFARNVSHWLISLETIFTSNRLPEAGIIAALRSGLVVVHQGQIPTALTFRGRPSRSRMLSAAAAQALQRAADVASGIIAQNQERLFEGERVARQIIAVSTSRALVPDRQGFRSNTEYLRAIRCTFAGHSDLESAAVLLESLVGAQDALVLIDRTLAERAPVTLATSAYSS